jgi:hypothetical protein
LFITYDLSGYYEGVYRELQKRYTSVDFYNAATARYRYKNLGERIYSFFYKAFTGKKLKNFYKYRDFITEVGKNEYDITLVVRPDLFFDSQLAKLRKASKRFIAYYHDSINNLNRKNDVIHFFDKIFSYEKCDVRVCNLTFLSNFIYFEPELAATTSEVDAFSVMSADYRLPVLKKVAAFFKEHGHSYRFFAMDDKPHSDALLTFITKRMPNDEVIANIRKAGIIVDIHKFGVQDGLTFRVFEALGFRKKLITTNVDIKTYDFYDPQNIFVIEDGSIINIPETFFSSPYRDLPAEIIRKYTVPSWLDAVLG